MIRLVSTKKFVVFDKKEVMTWRLTNLLSNGLGRTGCEEPGIWVTKQAQKAQ
jgi:hypothetical protein